MSMAFCLAENALVAVVGVVALFDDGGGSDYVVGGGVASGGLDGDAEREALPLCGLADGNEVIGFRPVADGLLHDGAARS